MCGSSTWRCLFSTASDYKGIEKLTPAPAIVICSRRERREIVDAARQAGALGYVFKTRIAHDVVAAVKCAARGVPLFPPPFDTTNTLLKRQTFWTTVSL